MMLLNETGFTYRGLHSRRDMGLIYAEKDGRIHVPRPRWNTYEIAGTSGTVLLPGETWDTFLMEGTLVPAQERMSQAQAQVLLRQVGAWLSGGRGRLIFDYETDKYYDAELDQESKWSLAKWFGGEISVRWRCQPFARAVTPDTAEQELTGTSASLALTVRTGRDAPLCAEVENTGTADITAVRICGGEITLSGMELSTGQILRISGEPPVGAEICEGTQADSAMRYTDRFVIPRLAAGEQTVPVQLTYGSGTKGARVKLSVRGMW